eukprot:9171253-Alexandrium_andersonii.AAC.1
MQKNERRSDELLISQTLRASTAQRALACPSQFPGARPNQLAPSFLQKLMAGGALGAPPDALR